MIDATDPLDRLDELLHELARLTGVLTPKTRRPLVVRVWVREHDGAEWTATARLMPAESDPELPGVSATQAPSATRPRPSTALPLLLADAERAIAEETARLRGILDAHAARMTATEADNGSP